MAAGAGVTEKKGVEAKAEGSLELLTWDTGVAMGAPQASTSS